MPSCVLPLPKGSAERSSSYATLQDSFGHSYSTLVWIPEEGGSWALPLRPERITSFVNQTLDIGADLLLRLAPNRCMYGAPPVRGRGAPAKQGHKIKLNDPETWSLPSETVEVEDAKLGRVRVTRWRNSQFRKSTQRPMEIIRAEVLETKEGKRRFAPLGLAWLGKTMPPLETVWLSY